MTISATRTREFTIGQIVTMAYRRAQLLNVHQSPSEVQSVAARDILETIIDHLQTKGLYARSITLERVAVAVGQNEVTLPSYVFDVIADGMWIPATDPNPDKPTTETFVKQTDRDMRQEVGSKSATSSQPTLFYTDRTVDPIKVWIWPTPTEAGFVRLQFHRLSADSNDATKTLDFERYWAEHFIWALAYRLAVDSGVNHSTLLLLKAEARESLDACRAYAMPRGAQQFYVDHPTAWSR